jgi:hypothetical protein
MVMSTDGAGGWNLRCGINRRQVVALLAAFGINEDALAQDAAIVAPRSYRVVLENDRVRVLEYRSRPGLGVCGEGMHYHPAHVAVSLTGAKFKDMRPDGNMSVHDVPAGYVFFSEAKTHAAEVIGGFDTRTYMIELKGKDWKPSTG